MYINFELLDAAIRDASTGAHGYRHNQGKWLGVVKHNPEDGESCGTAMCLAGFAAVLAGAEPPMPATNTFGYYYYPQWYVNRDTGKLSDPPIGVHVSSFAQGRLGLSDGQAKALFAWDNDLAEILAMRDALRLHPDADFDHLVDARNRVRK